MKEGRLSSWLDERRIARSLIASPDKTQSAVLIDRRTIEGDRTLRPTKLADINTSSEPGSPGHQFRSVWPRGETEGARHWKVRGPMLMYDAVRVFFSQKLSLSLFPAAISVTQVYRHRNSGLTRRCRGETWTMRLRNTDICTSFISLWRLYFEKSRICIYLIESRNVFSFVIISSERVSLR